MLRSVSQCILLWGSQGYKTDMFSPSSANKEGGLSDIDNYSIQQGGEFSTVI